MSVANAADAAGISKARWSQIENGRESRAGEIRPVSATDGLLAHMAYAIGVTPERLADAGREGAALVLREIQARRESGPGPYADDPRLHDVWLASAGLPEDARHGIVQLAREMRDKSGNGDVGNDKSANG
jgi:transcriptional regulator with XRE-family HTH domain